jgi:hypothetical protein
MRYQFRPLGPWHGPATPPGARERSPFKAGYEATLDLLWREIAMLGGQDLVLQVDLAERDIRIDGLPRANARYGANPGVVVSFASTHGPLRYATDAYTDWRANLRAIALSLQALRAVDRYGVSSRGEQYTGWRAIPAGNGSCFATADEARRWMREYAAGTLDLDISGVTGLNDLYRFMARLMHPDRGGARADWDRLDAARQMLATAGML